MPTLFTRIIEGELPGTFVWKDDLCVSFLTIEPLSEGHALVVPREEIDHWIDCPPDLRDHLFEVAATIGRAQHHVWQPEKIGLALLGLEVPHLHIHVLPVWGMHDLDFGRASATTTEALEEAAAKIIDQLVEAGQDPGV